MYEGNGDNEGTVEEQIHNCAVACDSKKSPLSGSWDGFVAKGFIIYSTGRCYCESPDSATCTRHANGYDRYDWGMQGIKIHPPFDTLKISPALCFLIHRVHFTPLQQARHVMLDTHPPSAPLYNVPTVVCHMCVQQQGRTIIG